LTALEDIAPDMTDPLSVKSNHRVAVLLQGNGKRDKEGNPDEGVF